MLMSIGAFAFGFAVVLCIRQGLSKTTALEVRIFAPVIAAILGAGALLTFGAVVYGATLWPLEFWFYPIGLVVGFIVELVFRKIWAAREEPRFFWFTVVSLLLAGTGLSFFSEEFGKRQDFVRALADAMIIAGVLAATVDAYIKQRTYREISVDVFKFILGYGLPPEFKNRIRQLVASSGLIRRDCEIRLKITPEANKPGMVKLSWEVTYKLDNISDRYQPYQYKVSHVADDAVQDAKILRLWCDSTGGADDYDMSGDALKPGPPDEAGDRWIKGKEIRVPPDNIASNRLYEVGCKYESIMREQQTDYHVFMEPTIRATVFVECPDDFDVMVFPRPDESHPRKWEYARLMFVHDVIFFRWAKKA